MESKNLVFPPGDDSNNGRVGGVGSHTDYGSILDPLKGGDINEVFGGESAQPSRATRFVVLLSVLAIVAAAGNSFLGGPFNARYETVSFVEDNPNDQLLADFSDQVLSDFPHDDDFVSDVSIQQTVVVQAPTPIPYIPPDFSVVSTGPRRPVSTSPSRPRPTSRPTQFKARPPSDDSELDPGNKTVLEDAFDTTERISEVYDQLQGEDPMEGFLAVIELAGEFSFLFGPLGPAVDVLATLAPRFLRGNINDQPDPYVEYMKERFDAIEEKLDQVFDRIDGIEKLLCDMEYDRMTSRTIGIFKKNLDYLHNPYNNITAARKQKREALRLQCVSENAPDTLLGWVQDMVKGDIHAACWEAIEKDSKFRVGYYRRVWVSMLLTDIMRAIEYQYICFGMGPLKPGDDVKKAVDSITEQMTEIKNVLDEFDKKLQGTARKTWIDVINNTPEYRDSANATVLYDRLKADFNPNYDYQVYQFNDQSNWDDYRWEESSFAKRKWNTPISQNRNYGSFPVNKKFVVFFKNKSTSVGSLPAWRNNAGTCAGKSMCFEEKDDCWLSWCSKVCIARDCHKADWMTWFTQQNNAGAFNTYADRGAVIIRTKTEYMGCVSYREEHCCRRDPRTGACVSCMQCIREGWLPNHLSPNNNGIVLEAGDDITTSFVTDPPEQPNGRDRTFYEVIGIGS